MTPTTRGTWAFRAAVVRIAAAMAVVTILITGFIVDWSGQDHQLFNYFGYFTNLTSLLGAVILAAAGIVTALGSTAPQSLVVARAVATSCLIVVAIVYNGLVPGTGSAPPWVSVALHIVYPVLVVADWMVVPDHPRPRWSQLWWVLPYPCAWITVVLLRGATDGWVPYGFLLPERGVLSLALHLIGLLLLLLVAAVFVWMWPRAKGPRGHARNTPIPPRE